ncbi:MAG: metallophosphoesterase [Paracoccaceae bacterium]
MMGAIRIEDMGVLKGEVALYGGPYSNAHATRSFLTAATVSPSAREEDAPATAWPMARIRLKHVALIRARGGVVVAGNCERQLATGAGDCGCGFAPGTACDRLSAAWYAHADRALGPNCAAGWRGCPMSRHSAMQAAASPVVHGGFTDISRFLWPSSSEAEFAGEIAALQECLGPLDIVVAGHCGITFQRQIGGVLWLNAGAIGLPPHDGRPETRFTVLAADGARVHRLHYDHAAAAGAMAAVETVPGLRPGAGNRPMAQRGRVARGHAPRDLRPVA